VKTPKVSCSLPQLQTLNDGRIQAKEEETKSQRVTEEKQPNKKKRYNKKAAQRPIDNIHHMLRASRRYAESRIDIDTLIHSSSRMERV